MEARYQEMLQVFMNTNYFAKQLGPEVLDIKEHYVRARLRYREELGNVHGVFHGGAIYSFGDSLIGIACRTEGGNCVTLQGSINYLKNTGSGYLYAETEKLHQGRSTAVYKVHFTTEDGILLAEATYTMYMFHGDNGKPSKV